MPKNSSITMSGFARQSLLPSKGVWVHDLHDLHDFHLLYPPNVLSDSKKSRGKVVENHVNHVSHVTARTWGIRKNNGKYPKSCEF